MHPLHSGKTDMPMTRGTTRGRALAWRSVGIGGDRGLPRCYEKSEFGVLGVIALAIMEHMPRFPRASRAAPLLAMLARELRRRAAYLTVSEVAERAADWVTSFYASAGLKLLTLSVACSGPAEQVRAG